jgi:hypothetical protein
MIEVRVALANTIRGLRERHELSQEQVAELLESGQAPAPRPGMPRERRRRDLGPRAARARQSGRGAPRRPPLPRHARRRAAEPAPARQAHLGPRRPLAAGGDVSFPDERVEYVVNADRSGKAAQPTSGVAGRRPGQAELSTESSASQARRIVAP